MSQNKCTIGGCRRAVHGAGRCNKHWLQFYRKSVPGFLNNKYTLMKRRVAGKNTKSPHLYEGKAICSKEEFLAWSLNDLTFHRLFKAWEAGGHVLTYVPSVDRRDAEKGYTLDNVRWVPFSENCENAGRKNYDEAA